MISRLRRTKRLIEQASPWKPASRLYLARDLLARASTAERPTEEHIAATIAWLKAAQDATGDGGVAGRFKLATGFSSSYPETTGYIVPTFIDLSERLGDPELLERAARMVEFLLSVQHADGAFPGSEVGAGDGKPVVFNTGQIIQGLVAWHAKTGDGRALDAAVRAGRWMCDAQNEDGSWTQFTYAGKATSYHARAAWPLAEVGVAAGERRFLEAASRHVDWVLARADPKSGWVDGVGFFAEDHDLRRGLTHTIAYTYRGLLELGPLLGRDDAWPVVRAAAENLLRRVELKGTLSAVYDHAWRERANYVCLTGCAQIAGVWMRLHRRFGDLRLLNGALKLIDIVKRAQVVGSGHVGIDGGVAGSYPIWGEYIKLAFPNWAAKFFLDALVTSEECLDELRARPAGPVWRPPAEVPTDAAVASAPRIVRARPAPPPRVVILSSPGSLKGREVLDALVARGVVPSAVVLDSKKDERRSVVARAIARLTQRGPADVARRVASRLRGLRGGAEVRTTTAPRMTEVCAEQGIPVLRVAGINTRLARRRIRALEADLFISAGSAILGDALLRLARLGTLNAHMGLLPRFRGMNAAEWSALEGAPLGCTVHLVDRGVDTGPILASREVDVMGATTLERLRALVNAPQIELLVEVAAAIVEGRRLEPYPQRPGDGAQHFVMHEALRMVLEERLARKEVGRQIGQAA